MRHHANLNIAHMNGHLRSKYGKESNEVTEEPESPCVNDEKRKYVCPINGR